MKQKIIYYVAACLLIFSACSDSNNSTEPEIPQAPLVLTGDYILAGKTNTSNQEVTQVDDMASYISLNSDYSGVHFDADKNTNLKFAWSGDKDKLTLPIDGTTQECKIEEKTYKNIPYNKLIVTRTVDGVTYSYSYIKAIATEASAEWKRFTQFDVADKTITSMNNDEMVAEIQTMKGRPDLLFNLGRKLADGSIDWYIISDFGQGENPVITLNDEYKVLVVYTPVGGSGLVYRFGDYNRETRIITWKNETSVDPLGKNPTIATGSTISATSSNSSLAIVYEREGDGIWGRLSYMTASSISMSAALKITNEGKNPTVTINNNIGDTKVVITYETENNEMAYMVGTGVFLTYKREVEWGTPVNIGEGVNPAISSNSRGDIIVTYKAPELPILLYSLGTINALDKTITFNKEDQYGSGIRHSVSINNIGDVLEVRTTKGMLWYYSSSLLNRTRNWMAKLDNNTLLSDITIPGTHDAAARYGGSLAKCQEMFIVEQLHAGVRFFDIRLNYVDKQLVAYHGVMKQYVTFPEIIGWFNDFMKAYPNETLIVCIKNEKAFADSNEQLVFGKAVKDLINEESHKWYTGTSIKGIKLGDVRNKIVLLRRYDSVEKFAFDATTWSNDASSVVDGYIHIQDEYTVSPAAAVATKKWPLVEEMFTYAINGKEDDYYINFTSGTGTTPVYVALGNGTTVPKGLNAFVDEYLTGNPSKKRLGIVSMDFIFFDTVDKLIETNF